MASATHSSTSVDTQRVVRVDSFTGLGKVPRRARSQIVLSPSPTICTTSATGKSRIGLVVVG